MGTSLLIAVLVASSGVGAAIDDDAIDTQNRTFQRFWGVDLEWKFDSLPTKSTVPASRVPYSGYIYPDTQGGTASILRKYDYAFHGGKMLATAHEKWDTTAFKERVDRGGFLGRAVGLSRMETPYWHGHCNGWTAATIRHAHPQKKVEVNGVVFTPADIKGLLAELYIYNDTLNLVGEPGSINAGMFHVVIANWLGRGGHPLGMESDPSEEKWNYPIYAYAMSMAKQSGNRVEVKMNLAYAKDSGPDQDESQLNQRLKYFHYTLTLNNQGEIVGGSFFRDSTVIDLLWLPLRPKPSGQPGNERGNPHLDVQRVLAIWRASVPASARDNWFVADPAEEDRIRQTELAWGRRLLPVQSPPDEDGQTWGDVIMDKRTFDAAIFANKPDANEPEDNVSDDDVSDEAEPAVSVDAEPARSEPADQPPLEEHVTDDEPDTNDEQPIDRNGGIELAQPVEIQRLFE